MLDLHEVRWNAVLVPRTESRKLYYRVSTARTKDVVADVLNYREPANEESQIWLDANARLIANAPRIYAMLRKIAHRGYMSSDDSNEIAQIMMAVEMLSDLQLTVLVPSDAQLPFPRKGGQSSVEWLLAHPSHVGADDSEQEGGHELYEDGDDAIPHAITDGHGAVVLALCKVCGGAESSLPAVCPGRQLSGDELNAITEQYHHAQDALC